MIGYNMTGTVTSTSSMSWDAGRAFPLPVALGDRITWTLQYDRSTPVSGVGPGWNSYTPNGPLITNIIDQRNANHWFVDPGAPAASTLKLSSSALPNQPNSFSSSFHTQSSSFFVDAGYTTELNLGFNDSIATSQLANLHLDSMHLDLSASYLHYDASVNLQGYAFTASVNTISGPIAISPEPGSLTLFLLGTAGLALYRLHPRFRRTLQHG
jgi:hypothetical protein